MSENNPGRGNINNGSSFKRPRLLSFQGPTSDSVAVNHGGRVPMAAGPSSSSLEEINVRHPALVDMRPGMAPDLASWQEAQIAACIEDNTINMVLEQYLNFFETRHYGVEVQGVVADQVEVAEIEPEQPEVEMIEDRAIMAAINERGLHPVQPIGDDAEDGDGASGSIEDGVERRRMDLDHHQQGMDLLETAVSAAIQEKGLTSAGNQFGRMDEDDVS